MVSLISFLNPPNVRVFASSLGLGSFRSSESQGRGGYHIHHSRQSLKALLRCLRLVFVGLVSSEFRAGISTFLNKSGQKGLVAFAFFFIPLWLQSCQAWQEFLCDLHAFVLSPRAVIYQDRTAWLRGRGLCHLHKVRLSDLCMHGPAS